jgi:hypothetical protein
MIFNPIDISTLITSVIIAVITVFTTIKLNGYIQHKNSKNGLITEIKRNSSKLIPFLETINEQIAFYTPADPLPVERNQNIIPLLTIPSFERSSFTYFSQNGYFRYLPHEKMQKIEELYNLIEYILALYHRDWEYQMSLHTPNNYGYLRALEENRFNILKLIKTQISLYQQVYDEIIDFLNDNNSKFVWNIFHIKK